MRLRLPVLLGVLFTMGCHKPVVMAQPVAEKPAIADIAIVEVAQRRFDADRLLKLEPLKVFVNEGVCTLVGSVGELQTKERALAVVSALRGVRAVVDQIDVTPVARPDADVTADIQHALAADAATHGIAITVTTTSGRVTVSGAVPSWSAGSLVREHATRVRGVKSVAAELRVDDPFPRTDAEVAEDVRSRLTDDVWLDGTPIDVDVAGGVVTLHGIVASVAQRERAAADAWMDAVTKVDPSAIVVDWARHDALRTVRAQTDRSDAEIDMAVRDALARDSRLSGLPPEVSVTGGIVELTGFLDDIAAKASAEADARDILGVVDVEDHTVAVPDRPRSDGQIDHAIARAFDDDMLIPNVASVHESSAKGRVVLKGDVDSPVVRSAAVEDVTRVAGVVEIVDELHVTRAPDVVRSDIEDRLGWDAAVARGQVHVAVDANGVATLEGTLARLSDIRAAIADAHAAGAARVVSQLAWQPPRS